LVPTWESALSGAANAGGTGQPSSPNPGRDAVLTTKVTRGSWTYVEKGGSCEEISNRTATVVHATGGSMVLDDVVLNWRNTAPCGN
jgi:hypothetical protein